MKDRVRPFALIVDDQPVVCKVLACLLEGWGMDTDTAENNTRALECARAHLPQLIITDMNRPGGTGLEFIRQIRALPDFSSVPIIFSSASASWEEHGQQAVGMGATFVPKPLDPKKLYAVVQGITKIGSDMGQVSLEAAEENLDDYVRRSMHEGAEEYLFDARIHLDIATDAGKDTSKHYERLEELQRASTKAKNGEEGK